MTEQTAETIPRERRSRFPVYAQILVGMAIGVLVGVTLDEGASPFGEIGRVVIQLIKTLAPPLLFFAILDVFIQMKVQARSAGWIAHALEQYAEGRLIRPRARYVGPPPRT